MTDPIEPTQADVEREFPGWAICTGTDQMCHARRTRGAALTVKGEDWQDLLDQIRRAEARLDESMPKPWRPDGDMRWRG